jgi:1,4-dihydroxy-2-naphthoate polyprenyltransferase
MKGIIMQSSISFSKAVNNFKTIAVTTRISFLILTCSCVFMGYSAVIHDGFTTKLFHLVLILTGALAAHISVNVLNEYFDFKSGLDLHTNRTPFSGGTGALPQNPQMAHTALLFAIACSALVFGISIFFIKLRGSMLLVPFIPGMLTMLLYSPFLVRQPILCLLAPGIGFGISMVGGTYLALSGSFSYTALTVSIIPFFLVSNLLLLNQFPDIEADINFGRKNVLIVYGSTAGVTIYQSFLLCTIATIMLAITVRLLPVSSITGIIFPFLSLYRMRGFSDYQKKRDKLIQQLSFNVVTVIVTPILLGITLFF